MKRNILQDNSTSKSSQSPLAHFYIYENLNYVADSRIAKEQISIGRSRKADVVLDHNAVADIHAFIHFEGQQAFLTNRYPGDGLHLNGRSVHLAELQHEDVIDIGPYALKVKMDESNGASAAGSGQDAYCVALINRYKSDDDMQAAAEKLAKHFRADPVKMALIIVKPEYVIKKDLSLAEAERWQIALQKAGIFCDMRAMTPQAEADPSPAVSPEEASPSEEETAPPIEARETHKVEADLQPQTPKEVSGSIESDASPLREAGESDHAKARQLPAEEIDTPDRNVSDQPIAKATKAVYRPVADRSRSEQTIAVETARLDPPSVVSSSETPSIETDMVSRKKTEDEETDQITLQPPPVQEVAAPIDEVPEKPTDKITTPARKPIKVEAPDDSASPTMQKEALKPPVDLGTVAAPSVDHTLHTASTVATSQVKPEKPSLAKFVKASVGTADKASDAAIKAAPVKPVKPAAEKAVSKKILWYVDEEEDEEDPWFAPFSLKEKLSQAKKTRPTAMQTPSHLQVVKSIGDNVVDVQFLAKGQKYTIATEEGKLHLASNKGKHGPLVCIAQNFNGYINNARGETTADINSYKRSDYLFKKRQQFYRIPMPEAGEVVVNQGQNQYRIVNARPSRSPAVRVAAIPSEFSWRHWAFSAVTHVVLAVCLSVYWYFQMTAATPTLPHFVKIDPSILEQMQPKKLPEPPKVEPPPPEPEPVKVAEKLEPPKKEPPKPKPKPIAKPTKPKRKIKKVAKARRPSRHPKAGGGFGKGNIKNRNINQTGILSVLGKTPLSGPSTAIASVTNLDAVKVPGATDKNFSVGGVKGSLGNGKISVASGEMLETKGSELVLRSAGAKGPGHVAALEKGNTGKKQVQAMVTAKMSRTVKIRGGMSREMVKQVIDQHLEEITYCYETALMSNPSIMGRIVFEWKIMMSGRVGQIRIVASSVNSHEVHNCIKSAIKSWQFPKPQGAEVVVSYPFVFDLVAF